eukprot:4940424-Pyramimonas_sp.AAC.1
MRNHGHLAERSPGNVGGIFSGRSAGTYHDEIGDAPEAAKTPITPASQDLAQIRAGRQRPATHYLKRPPSGARPTARTTIYSTPVRAPMRSPQL